MAVKAFAVRYIKYRQCHQILQYFLSHITVLVSYSLKQAVIADSRQFQQRFLKWHERTTGWYGNLNFIATKIILAIQ